MRYIDLNSIVIPKDWLALSKEAKTKPLWSYLKPAFEDAVGKKCWYNESINDGASNPIDHFRPKSTHIRVLSSKYANLTKEIWEQLSTETLSGYPFLELEPLNYRYACGFANSLHVRENEDGVTRGKWNFFPLQVGTKSVSTFDETSKEQIALLDPCKIGDAELITFNQFGGIDVTENILDFSWEYCKVKVSIEVYNLMYHIISGKRKELWTTAENNIEIISLLYNKSNKSIEEQKSLDHLFLEFVKLLQKKSQYSAVVIDCVKYYRKRKEKEHYKWLHEIIPDKLLIK